METQVDQRRITASALSLSNCAVCGGSGRVSFATKGHYIRAASNIEWIEEESISISADMPDGTFYATYPGYIRTFDNCECRIKAVRRRNLEKIMDGQKDTPGTMGQYSLTDFNAYPHAAATLHYLYQLIEGSVYDEEVGENKGSLLVSGPTGTGKSTAVSCAFIVLAQKYQGHWINFNTLSTRLKSYLDDEDGFRKIEIATQALRACELLVIDDLGSLTRKNEQPETVIEAVRSIFEYRLEEYRRGKLLPTIITTNLSKDELYAQFGERAVSRLRGLCACVTMDGADFRAPGDRR